MSKWIDKLILENFQSHEHTIVSLDQGFNVIIGASDQGKSAIIRALRWLLYNEPRGTDFIRAGTTVCRVTAIFNDGVQVVRERTPSKNRYILQIPGQEEEIFEGFGNQVPTEIVQAHGITKVRLDEDTETILNLGGQLEGPFLLSANGSVKAKAIGRISGVHVIDGAQRETVRDLQKLQQEERQLTDRRKEIGEELAKFSDLPQLATLVTTVNNQLKQVGLLQQHLKSLQLLKEKQARIDRELARVEVILEHTKQLSQVTASFVNTEALTNRWQRYRTLNTRLQSLNLQLQQSEKLLTVTQQVPLGETQLGLLEQKFSSRKQLVSFQLRKGRIEGQLTQAEQLLRTTKAVPGLAQSLVKLEAGQEKLELLTNWHQRYHRLEQELTGVHRELTVSAQVEQGVKQVNDLESTVSRLNTLHNTAAKLKEIDSRLVKGEEFLQNVEAEIDQKLLLYQQALQELGRCPLCLGNINAECLKNIKLEYQGG